MFRDFAPKTGYFFFLISEKFLKMDPCLGILGPKVGPMFRDFFCQEPTHLGGPSPYRVSMGVPPPPRACNIEALSSFSIGIRLKSPKNSRKIFCMSYKNVCEDSAGLIKTIDSDPLHPIQDGLKTLSTISLSPTSKCRVFHLFIRKYQILYYEMYSLCTNGTNVHRRRVLNTLMKC